MAAVIDLGGDNTYYEGTVSLERPVLVILDLGGNNVYRATKPGIQGGAILGVSMLVNLEGNDVYEAQDVAQGSAWPAWASCSITAATTTIAASAACRDRPWAAWASSSTAAATTTTTPPCGPRASAARWASACWTTSAGDDHYYCGGLYPNSYKPETPGYEGWGQGVGAGIRQWPTAASA